MRQNEEITLTAAVMAYFMAAVNKTTNHASQNTQLTSVPHSSAHHLTQGSPICGLPGNTVRPAATFVNYVYTIHITY